MYIFSKRVLLGSDYFTDYDVNLLQMQSHCDKFYYTESFVTEIMTF
jgi:hypothetical protein